MTAAEIVAAVQANPRFSTIMDPSDVRTLVAEIVRLRGENKRYQWRDVAADPPPTVTKAMFWLDWADDIVASHPDQPFFECRLFVGKNRCWSSLYKATHWRELPLSPYHEGLPDV